MLRTATALAASLALLVQPLAAQDMSAPPRLEDLIPDSAVADPESWAAQGNEESDLPPEEAPMELDVDSPMEPMPLVTLGDPTEIEAPEIEPLQPEQDIQFADFSDTIPPLPEGSEERISDELVLVFPTDMSLFPERDEFLDRFKQLSTIEELGNNDNIAQLGAQARADEELLQRMLRTYGYFDGQVIRSVAEIREDGDTTPPVRFDVIPGTRFQVGRVDLGDLADAGSDYSTLRAAYEVFPGDPLSQDAIVDEQADLDQALGEFGYPFAEIAAPELLVDHERQEGDVTLPVTPGGKYVFGQVTSDMDDFLSGKHLARIARFEPGEIYQRSAEMDLRRAILATGLVGSATVTPVEVRAPADGEPGVVDMEVGLTKAPLRTITGSIGFGTEEGIRLAGSWEHRNLFPPEGMLRVRGIAGTQEQLLGVTFRKNNFKARDRILTVDAFAHAQDYDFYDARTLSLITQYERVSTLLFQKPLSWGAGFELTATREAEVDPVTKTATPRQTYLVAALPSFAQIDTSDDLLNPTEGYRVRGAVSPEVSRVDGNTSTYLKVQFDLSYYQPVSDGVVLAGRARAGSIVGAPTEAIAPSRRFYAGGGGSVRGYGYQAIGPRNSVGEPNGGRSVFELSAEARIRTGMFDGALEVVPFVDAGTVDRDTVPSFGDIRFGAGVGARYYTSFGPIRLDVAVPLNREPGDNWVAVYVALGQAF